MLAPVYIVAGNTIGYQTNFTGTGGSQTSGYASGVVPTPVESVEEVRVSVFGQGADFNNSSGAAVQMVTKRGTNQYHGSAYGFYYATNVGAANSWANNHTPSNLPGFGPLSYTPLISNHRTRYPESAQTARCDLHLALWNPFQVLDIAAPAVVTWGYADGALDALRAWLEGRAQAPGRSPVRLAPRGNPENPQR